MFIAWLIYGYESRPEVNAFQNACIKNTIWGCFSLMECNPNGNPYNSGIIINSKGEIVLYYRKLHPWVPGEAIHIVLLFALLIIRFRL